MDENNLEEVYPESSDHGGYQAKCSEHSPHWMGQCRPNNSEAFEDAKAHDRSFHNGKGTATVSRSICTP